MTDFSFEPDDEPLGPDPVVPPEWFLRYLRSALNLPIFSVPKPFEAWMIDKVATSGFDLPIGQIVGFSQFTVQTAARVNTSENTNSETYGDLTTPGPSLAELPPGKYAVFFGARAGGDSALMTVEVNGVAADDDDAAEISISSGSVSISGYRDVTLTAASNTLKVVYRTSAAANAAGFARRWLAAMKYANN